MASIVIWDWNGTLLNDVQVNFEIVNTLLAHRNIPLITFGDYRRFFRMPIKDFYADIGFSFEQESFQSIAAEYVRLYDQRFDTTALTSGIERVLERIREKRIKQYIVSATNQTDLDFQVSDKGIAHYFAQIIGNDDYSVISKKEKAIQLASAFHSNDEIVFIGDMYHDYEVAKSIGATCFLYSNGHQSVKDSEDYRIIENMEEILKYL